MAFNVLVVDDSTVMRAMVIKTLNMSELPLGEVRGVVLISTESSSTRIAALREKGAGFVHKPFSPVALRDEVLRITGATIE